MNDAIERELRIEPVGLDQLELLLDWRIKVLKTVFAESKDADWGELRESNRFFYMETIPTGVHVAVMAWVDDEPVGCGGVCYQPEMPSPDNPWCESAYLMNIYVEPAWRNNGAGRHIVDYLIRDARHKGIKKIYLETSDCARDLYLDIGFKPMNDMLILK